MNGPHHGLTKCTLDHDLIWEDRGLSFGGNQCRWPRGVAVDSGENVYVSDDYTSEIFMYGKDGEFQGKWGTRSLAEKSLAGFRATISRRITVLYGMTVYVIRCKTLLLHR